MLDTDTKRRIDTARDILVGKVPDPKSQVEQITIALIYKFMDDMDAESEELGGNRKFFTGIYARYGWAKLMAPSLGGHEMLGLYGEGISKMPENPGIPPLFRDIFKNAYLPYRDPETLKAFLKIIDEFSYDHSERLGDAFEYLLSVLGSQGDAGQFRTPRHIIDFMVEVLAPQKNETILDPACGTAGFLISAWKHILRNNSSTPQPSPQPSPSRRGSQHFRGGLEFAGLVQRARELRVKQTEAETFLWELLRDRQLGDSKFRRQHQFGEYICDFFCPEARLVVECDGPVHDTLDLQRHDQRRDAYLKSQGLTVLRFQNDRVLNDTAAVLEEIAHQLPSTTGRGVGGAGEVARMSGDLLTPDEKGRLAKNFKGYDISPDMVRLSLVNLYLHGFTDPHIYEYDTLTSEERWNEFADVILANPPFMSPKGGIKPHKRFSIQAKRSEVLFVDYMAEHLTPTGRAGIIVPEGIIFQSQDAYRILRKMLVENSLVAVVSLPAGCFNPYSGVKTSILILDKSLARQSDTIAFFKVENDGFGLGAQRRAIERNDLPAVQAELAAYLQALRTKTSTETVLSRTSTAQVVPKGKIAANGDYNLSGERYREGAAKTNVFPLVKLSEVCTVNPRKSQVDEKPETRVSFVPMADLNEHRISFQPSDEKQLSEVSASYTYFEDNDVLLAKVTPCFENGKAGIARDLLNGIGFGSSEFYVLRSNGQVMPEWVYFCVMHPLFRETAVAQMTGTGGLQRVPRDYVENFQIPLPPLEVQKEIVAEIDGYQNVINGARAVLDHYRPHIPVHPDWPMVELGEAADFISGFAFKSTDMTAMPVDASYRRVVKIGNVGRDGQIDIADAQFHAYTDDLARFVLRVGDVVMAMTGATVGKVAVVKEDGFLLNQRVGVLRAKPTALQSFVLHLLCSVAFYDFCQRTAGGGAQGNIAPREILEYPIPLPPLATQQAIVAEIEAEQKLVAGNRELISRFEKKIQTTLARIWGEAAPAASP